MGALRVVSGTGYGNVYVDSLVWGKAAWEVTSPIKLGFMTSPTEEAYWEAVAAHGGQQSVFVRYNTLRYEWNEKELKAKDYVLNLFKSVTHLDFAPATNFDEADLLWWKIPFAYPIEDYSGAHEAPGQMADQTGFQFWGFFNASNPSWQEMDFGGDGLNTLIHEMGHALGLGHPHDGGGEDDSTTFPGVPPAPDLHEHPEDGSTGEHDLNQNVYTVMSYNPGLSYAPATAAYGNQGGLGAFDIAALQALYGANMSTATGDDVYYLPHQNARGTGWSSIWDAGGSDTISGINSTAHVIIDLRAATLISHDPHAGGYISRQTDISGGFTIANKVVIENATGGSGDDTLVGNNAANVLIGNAGEDILRGEAGADFMDGGTGDDIYYVDLGTDRVIEASSGGSRDEVQTTVSYVLPAYVELLTGRGSGSISLTGNTLSNTILGTAGSNRANGAYGNDKLYGYNGNDLLYGDIGNDYLNGGAHNDRLFGGTGNDLLYGGAGADSFVFNTRLHKSANVDYLGDFYAPHDTIRLENAIFRKLTKTGGLSSSFFEIGTKAGDRDDYIIYNKTAGYLSYDYDGSGRGAAILFAKVKKGAALTHKDFYVI